MPNITDTYNFRPVSDMLSTSGQPTKAQLQAARADRYEVIINLALHDDPRYSLPDEKGLVENLDMVYVHIPVPFDAPGEDDLLAFFQAMETYHDRKIHIHCAANKRVTAFLGLYYVIKQRQPETEAFELMKTVWQPDDIWSLFISDMIAKYANGTTGA